MAEIRARSHDGTEITALDEGAGRTLLVVHPGGGDATAWGQVSRMLADGFRVVRVRRRIYTPGADLSSSHSMAIEAADIVAIARLLERPVLVGHSSGALAALEAALLAPDAFRALFLYEPPVPSTSLVAGEAGLRASRALADEGPQAAMRIHLRDIVRMPAHVVDVILASEEGGAAIAAHAAAQMADNEAIDALGTGVERYAALALPTTLVEGDRSPDHLRERLADLAAVLPEPRVVTLQGQSHIAHLTAPKALADAVREAARRAPV